jgi:peptide/nickel transport system substrate-binding protein
MSTLVAGIGMLVSACGGSSTTTSETPKNGGTLTFVLDSDTEGFNPFVPNTVATVRAENPLWPDLYEADKNLNVVPGLADGMPSVSTDGKVWTVKLKKTAKWSDGKPITATDVVTTVNIQNNPDLDTDRGFDWAALDKIEKVDDYTVKYTLKEPAAPFLARNLVGWIHPAHVFGAMDVKKMRTDPSMDHPTVTGGPYLFDKRIPGQEVDYLANPNYFLGRPHPDKLVGRIITDSTAAINALINGDVQYNLELTSAALDKAKQEASLKVYTYPDLGYYDVRMNHRPGHPFEDKKVRQAFAYALDKDSIVQAATQGHGTTLWGDIPPASWAYDPNGVVKYKQNVDTAKSLLKDAGWTPGAGGILQKNGKPFSYNFCVRAGKPQRVKAVEIMSEQLKAVGMDLKVTPIDFKVYYKGKAKGGCGIQTGEFDLAFAGFGLDLDPDDWQEFHSSQLTPDVIKTGNNWTGYKNPALDALIDQERVTVKATDAETKKARKEIFNKIEKILGDDVVTYFMWSDNHGMGFNKVVGGVVGGGDGAQDLNYYDQDRSNSYWAKLYLKTAK